jgi:hypothetical protein
MDLIKLHKKLKGKRMTVEYLNNKDKEYELEQIAEAKRDLEEYESLVKRFGAFENTVENVDYMIRRKISEDDSIPIENVTIIHEECNFTIEECPPLESWIKKEVASHTNKFTEYFKLAR